MLTRREFITFVSGLLMVPGVSIIASETNSGEGELPVLTKEVIAQAEKIAGLELTDAERELMLEGLKDHVQKYDTLRGIPLPNSVTPALQFQSILPGRQTRKPLPTLREVEESSVERPDDLEEIAFWPVTHLAHLVRTRQVTSVELTQLYLERLKRYDPQLKCVITLTEELAWKQAHRADEEIAQGYYRGALHGIPWGAKDLLATKGIKTTWGATPYQDQVIDTNATVVERLEESGAVLIAKLTLGALAWGDVWFGGMTRNPWNPETGSSGSSAGSASATAAGLLGFAIGTETLGSIVSPCTHCGVTGLRPTFGRVSRYGAMALSWSMDKIGPICRSVDDCALVFDAIRGPDGKDATLVDVPFAWEPEIDVSQLRIGYLEQDISKERENTGWRQNDLASLEQLSELGFQLESVVLPDFPVESIGFVLAAEAAASFDELTRSNRDDEMVRQIRHAWPNVFRQARFIPAVEYIQANRARTLLMERMEEFFAEIDVLIAPSFEGSSLQATNLTGHPTVVVPNGFSEGMPTSICFISNIFDESRALAVAKAYQRATNFHLQRPPLSRG